MMTQISRTVLVLVLAGITGLPALAQEAVEEDLRYVELQPTFVANFGSNASRKLMYVKTDVTVRVSSKAAEEATIYHLPALRNELVLLLSRQDEAALTTGTGREAVRAAALDDLNAILKEEEGQAFLKDLMFTNFIVQR